MVLTYQELKKQKDKEEILDWDHITKEQLEFLFIDEKISNRAIAELYQDKVRSKRKKWDISIYSAKYMYKNYVKNNEDLYVLLNQNAKMRLMNPELIDTISKALTHYVFRNGPVEDMHADGKLTQQDMKTLNKYMVNRIAGLLKLAEEGEWLKISLMLDFLKPYGNEWDKAEYDTEDIEKAFQNL